MKKILWLTNKVLSQVDEARGKEAKRVNEGWISQMFAQLSMLPDIHLSIICGGAKESISGSNDTFKWYIFKENRDQEVHYSDEITRYFVDILLEEKPDIIHIWGSEYPHTLEMVCAAAQTNYLYRVVVSLQGIISACSLCYSAGIPQEIVKRRYHLDVIRKTGIEDANKDFYERGKSEIVALSKVNHCIGRTDWDYYMVKSINRSINYHKCNETLRDCFYHDIWNYDTCVPYTIFVSQATYPLKGFHFLVNALPIVLKECPQTKVFVSGMDITSTKTFMDYISLTSYGKYLRDLILKNRLQNKIVFLGRLDANSMKKRYLSSNVFVSCSRLENSPNSVGEAMILGTPIVASDVGGTSSILKDKEEGLLYQWDSPEQLAKAILDVFQNKDVAIQRSKAARQHALETHNAEKNFQNLLNIYTQIIDSNISC